MTKMSHTPNLKKMAHTPFAVCVLETLTAHGPTMDATEIAKHLKCHAISVRSVVPSLILSGEIIAETGTSKDTYSLPPQKGEAIPPK